MRDAIDALKCYPEAVDASAHDEEVAHLNNEAEALFQAVSDYLLRATGGQAGTLR